MSDLASISNPVAYKKNENLKSVQRISSIRHTVYETGWDVLPFFYPSTNNSKHMKMINNISLLLLFLVILFSACQKENFDVIIVEDPEYQTDTIDVNPLIRRIATTSPNSIYLDCVSIPYPVEFLQASGNTITINSEAELDSAGMLADSIVNFVYPLDAIDDNGPLLIEDLEGLILAIQACAVVPVAACPGQNAHVLLFFNALNILTLNKYVYEINYPVDLIVEGTQVTITNDSEYLPAVGGSPFDLLETELVYPISITQFGRDIVLNSDADVCQFSKTLDEPCENKPAHIQFFFNGGIGTRLSCAYFINYPFTITSNGNTIPITTGEDYLNELNSSPNAYFDIELVYPVTASKSTDGQQISFGTDADICQYLDNCQ